MQQEFEWLPVRLQSHHERVWSRVGTTDQGEKGGEKVGEKADFLKLSDLVELFRQTRYSDGSPVIWYLPFPTQTDGIVLWELPAKENMGKTEWKEK